MGVKVLSKVKFFLMKNTRFLKRNMIVQYSKMLLNIRIYKDNGVLIVLEARIILALFSHKPQMDHICQLRSKCLKEDASFEKCI